MTEPWNFVDDRTLHVGTVRFHCDLHVTEAPDGELAVMKPRPLVERLLRLLRERSPSAIVELGVNRGGSTALVHAVARPDRLIAIELAQPAPEPLVAYLAEHDQAGSVRAHFGVDQADRARLAEILAADLDGRPIDLVLDDASHLLHPTRASFEALFPSVRPGGVYVIEDWQGDRLFADAIAARVAEADGGGRAELAARLVAEGWSPETQVPTAAQEAGTLLQLPIELVLARSGRDDVIRSVTVLDHWVVVERGDDPIDPTTFRLHDLVGPDLGLLPHR